MNNLELPEALNLISKENRDLVILKLFNFLLKKHDSQTLRNIVCLLVTISCAQDIYSTVVLEGYYNHISCVIKGDKEIF